MTALRNKATNQKQTFLGGAAVLALATAIVKVIGAFYKIPLNRLIGDEGFGYFNTAYDIYSVLLMISTTGLPVAMSRMISEAKALGQTNQIHRIYKTAFAAFLALGLVGSGGMMILCKALAGLMSQSESWFAILCLSPAMLFICLISAERGFFQGQSNMVPTSMSQILEALCKLAVGLSMAFLFNRLTGSMTYAAGGAILGVTLGTVVSTIYLTAKRRKASREMEKEPCLDPTELSSRQTLSRLLAIAVPITLGAAGLQIITTVDAAVYMARLKGAAGLVDEADGLKGIYNFAQTIFNLPCAFISPLTISVIPAITEQITLRRHKMANTVAESATRVMSLIAMPCSVGLVVLAEPIMQVLGGYDGARLELATVLMRILGFCVFFNSFVLVLNAIMQAHGFVYIPVIFMVVGGIVKVIVNYILVGNPDINIVGAPIGTLVCYVIIALLDVFAMRRVLRHPPKMLQNLYKPALASLVMGAAAYGAYQVSVHLHLAMILRLGFTILLAAAAYAVMAILLRTITADDCKLLPKGDKIAKLLHIS